MSRRETPLVKLRNRVSRNQVTETASGGNKRADRGTSRHLPVALFPLGILYLSLRVFLSELSQEDRDVGAEREDRLTSSPAAHRRVSINYTATSR